MMTTTQFEQWPAAAGFCRDDVYTGDDQLFSAASCETSGQFPTDTGGHALFYPHLRSVAVAIVICDYYWDTDWPCMSP